MKLVFLIGDAAVGKMTVGQELMKITDLRLFHNHMTIEPVLEILGFPVGVCRQPLTELSDATKTQVEEAISKFRTEN